MFPLKDNIATRRFPILTVGLIAACAIVYFVFEQGLWQLGSVGQERVTEYGFIPAEVTGDAPDVGPVPWWVTIFTSMFMHGSLLHLGFNMLFLWIFGNNIEDSMGRARFVAFYLLGGVAAAASQIAIDPDGTIPTVGASGAIAAVLGGYALLYPRARVITLIFVVFIFTVIEVPALVVLGVWFALQVAAGIGDLGQPVGEGGGVAYFAHIGGFLFGLLFIKLFANRVHEDYERQHRIPVY